MIEKIYQSNARALGVRFRISNQQGRSILRRPDDVRADCVESLYGQGQGLVMAKSPREMDRRIATGIQARAGKLGRDIQAAQFALRAGRDALTELHRIQSLTRRRPAEEATLLATVKARFAEAETAMDRHTAKRITTH